MLEIIFNENFIIGLLAAAVRFSTPLILPAFGEILAERSGVLNLGVEGIMLMGAFLGFIGAYFTGDLFIGIAFSIIIGAILGLIHAFVCVTLRANQIVSGMAIWFLGWGMSGFLYRMIFGIRPLPVTIEGFKTINVPLLSEIPFIGQILFQQNLLVYISLILIPIMYLAIFKTTFGLKIRATGENPRTADVAGVNVYLIRYICVITGGALAGLGGGYLSLAHLNMFIDNMTLGRGFIAIAIVYFGKWNPYKTFIGALIFGGVDALQSRLQAMKLGIPFQFLLMLPYALTILALLGLARKAESPAALTIPYQREEKE
ncbi:MAG: ABC transporter permease [Candidatus Bathyarchaeia archaeon]